MRVVGVLLAAGSSSRFGSPKLSYALADGDTIGLQSARKLITVVEEGVAVVREQDQHLADALTALGYRTVCQHSPTAGMGDSLALGVHATRDADGWLIALADMPWIMPATLQKVVYALQHGSGLVAPYYQGRRGHPVGFGLRWRDDLLALRGDSGARQIIQGHSDQLTSIDVDDAGIVQDVDCPQDVGA